jgi:hypothetical protein
MSTYRTIAAILVLAAVAACGPGEERVDESYRQQTIAPAEEALQPGDTTISGQIPVVDRPHLPREKDTMGAGAGSSVTPPGTN